MMSVMHSSLHTMKPRDSRSVQQGSSAAAATKTRRRGGVATASGRRGGTLPWAIARPGPPERTGALIGIADCTRRSRGGPGELPLASSRTPRFPRPASHLPANSRHARASADGASRPRRASSTRAPVQRCAAPIAACHAAAACAICDAAIGGGERCKCSGGSGVLRAVRRLLGSPSAATRQPQQRDHRRQQSPQPSSRS